MLHSISETSDPRSKPGEGNEEPESPGKIAKVGKYGLSFENSFLDHLRRQKHNPLAAQRVHVPMQ